MLVVSNYSPFAFHPNWISHLELPNLNFLPRLAMDLDHVFTDLFETDTISHTPLVPQLLPSSPEFDMDFSGYDFTQLATDDSDKIFSDGETGDHEDLEDIDLEMDESLMNDDPSDGDSWACDPHVKDEDNEDDAAVDQKIYQLFPMEALKKPRSEFGQWKKTYKVSAVRSLTPRETKRLAAVRRVVLARVYAEKARIKKGRETDSMKERLSKLQGENQALRGRVQTLERILADLQNKFAKAHPQR